VIPQTVIVYQNDLSPPIRGMLVDQASNPIPLAGVTVVFSMSSDPSQTSKVNKALCTILDPVNGIFEYDWVAGDTDTPMDYQAEIYLTWTNGRSQSATQFIVSVLPSLH